MSERVFDGLKVIDCASFIAGPAAATVMSDFGAEVDQDRAARGGRPLSPARDAAEPGPGRWQPRLLFSTGATRGAWRSICAPTAGRAVLRRLVREADVFITNYPPPVRRRLGITYDELAPLNERLIYASFTGYGESGPEADKPGFDATAWWARTGLMHLVRAGEEATPARSLPGMGDHPSAMGDLWRDRHRALPARATGKGDYVGSSLLANGLWANGCSVQAALCGEKVVPQPPRERGVKRCGCITSAATGAGCCCRSPPTSGAGRSSRHVSTMAACSTTRALPRTRSASGMPGSW